MSTIVSVKDVNHCREVKDGETFDHYVTKDKGLPVKMTVTSGDDGMKMELSYTNIPHYKE